MSRREDMSLRPRPGETAQDTVDRVIAAARRSDATASGDDTAGTDDHNRAVETVDPDGTVRDGLDNAVGIDQPAAARRFRDHGEEIKAMQDGTHPGLQS